jgi:hypothetical protein
MGIGVNYRRLSVRGNSLHCLKNYGFHWEGELFMASSVVSGEAIDFFNRLSYIKLANIGMMNELGCISKSI